MATYSQYLGLKLNAPSDPFQLTDFTTNWSILDASPGTFICTSTSRPAWTASQAGRLIFMTDLKQLSYFDGAAWNDLRDSAPIFYAGVLSQTWISSGASPNYGVCTFTTPRPCALAVIMTVDLQSRAENVQSATCTVTIDGTAVTGAFADITNVASVYFTSPSPLPGWVNVPVLAMAPSLTAGAHTIGVTISVGSVVNNPVQFYGAKAMGIVSLFSSSNTL